MSRTYLNLTNDAIQESGASLQTFETDGSDWNTLSDPSSRRFKSWVARAWKDIQQEANDWEFLNTKAVVSVDPGIEFYTDAVLNRYVTPSSVTIYGRDGVVKYADVPVKNFIDLSNRKAAEPGAKKFGYFNIDVPEGTDISYSLKAGNDYFLYGTQYRAVSTRVTPDSAWPPPAGTTLDVFVGSSDPSLASATYYGGATLVSYDPTGDGGNPLMVWTFDSSEIADSLAALDIVYLIYKNSFVATSGEAIRDVVTVTQGTAKCYIRGWKSYDFSEENNLDDYQIAIKEIQEKSFRLITKNYPEAGRETPLINMPYGIFNNNYDLASTRPNCTPAVISEDNEGRWRLYPPPSRPVTLLFDYTRKPQVLSLFSDYPWYLPEEYSDLVMWKALMYYGEFDEQPSIYMRAQKHYKDLLQRLEWQFRPKLQFVPHRLY